jgi:hypothetical protein
MPWIRFAVVVLGAGVVTSLTVAVAIWPIGPLPPLLTIAAFIKLHRMFVMFHALGWLVKLLVLAGAVASFLA